MVRHCQSFRLRTVAQASLALRPRYSRLLLPLAAGPRRRREFQFSQQDAADKAADKAEDDARQGRIATELATPCRADLKGKKIMVVDRRGAIERRHRRAPAELRPAYSRRSTPRLRSLGLRTFTPEEIRAQIAQAEIDAYFRNDPDAALAASKKLGASFVLKGADHRHRRCATR